MLKRVWIPYVCKARGVAELRRRGILAKSHRRPASFEKVHMSASTHTGALTRGKGCLSIIGDRVLLCVEMHNADIGTFQMWTMLLSLDNIDNALAVIRDVPPYVV